MAERPREEPEPGAANRGTPATVAANGEAVGSGAGAGGGGAPDDIDSDSAGGSGANLAPTTSADHPSTGADASNHGSR